ncbi:DUF3750 domain-containing protein [Rhizobium sp. YIM 134829]|uniref:DUF3750 domain-containing protein n=1 Tax=Rhizobium sp. YIM 134829 TaxID=3390453 RepID=UPI003979FBCD
MLILRHLLLAFLLIYLLPTIAAAGVWIARDRPARWSEANWSSSGLLPKPQSDKEAAIYVLSAATGGLKGAVASHAWIVTKGAGDTVYNRYDKVGWGTPIRRNMRDADGFWYSNPPRLVVALKGAEAERLIPKVEAAIQSYPYAMPGAYRLWPGPNSNTFVAHVLRSVPDLGAVLPPDAVGRDYLPEGRLVSLDADGRDLHLTLFGLVGLSAGIRSGFELHILGLVAGLDLANPGIKIPGFGRLGV